MRIHRIEWFDEFECMGGECPQTCCRGWLIPLDEDDLVRYSNERGRLGLSLFMATAGYRRTRINLFSGECRYHTKEGLCRLQLEKGHEFIPWACRSFPRFYRNYGDFEERYLDLSCIAAAKLFVRNSGNLRIAEDEGDPETKLCTTNDDRGYLHKLLGLRDDIVRELTGPASSAEDAGGIISKLPLLYSYSCMLQDMYARGGADVLVPMFSEYQRGKEVSGSAFSSDKVYPADDPEITQCFPFSLKLFGRLTESLLGHFGQKKTGPQLYGLLKDTEAFIDRCRRDEGALETGIERLFFCNPPLPSLLTAYLSYYLYQYFLEAYETYSFRKITALGIIHTNMILLLMLVMADAKQGTDTGGYGAGTADKTGGTVISEYDIAYITAIYNRKAYFNETVQNDLYRIFEQ